MRLDAVICGGGAAGLWLLDRLSRQGCHVVLLEAHALGAGQTIAAQGIIHGGLKYTLQGLLTGSAKSIRGMPNVWRNALLGNGTPNLTHTKLRAECCYLWQTDTLSSRAGMIGAKIGLKVKPETVPVDERPSALASVPGVVARLAEQVICPASFLADLLEQYRDRILLIDGDQGVRFQLNSPGEIDAVRLTSPVDGGELVLKSRQVVFTAGGGNARLRKLAGLDDAVMQRRPLHMTLVRGALPQLNGHCVDGAHTRVTITSAIDAAGRTVWQIGGQVSEDGVKLSPLELTRHVRSELSAVLPGVTFDRTEWSTYQIDRAEGATPKGSRPETVQVLCAGNVTTGWPTKLALAPVLADEIASRITAEASRKRFDPSPLAGWPRPAVAALPWEEPERAWWPLTDRTVEHRRAA
jgi:glycine/D-amino acid oxidase-like deaminating enzyme